MRHVGAGGADAAHGGKGRRCSAQAGHRCGAQAGGIDAARMRHAGGINAARRGRGVGPSHRAGGIDAARRGGDADAVCGGVDPARMGGADPACRGVDPARRDWGLLTEGRGARRGRGGGSMKKRNPSDSLLKRGRGWLWRHEKTEPPPARI